jgi:HlyD family secretion protein
MRLIHLAIAALTLAACQKAQPPAPPYLAVAVERRDLIVSAQASGAIQPDTTVEVKSQASGEILSINIETGQVAKRGDLMVHIDPRIPKNNVEQAAANLDVAKARLANSEAQKNRSDELFQSQSITQTEHESAVLDYATAKAGVISAQVALQNAQITLDQSEVRAPINGTIIELDVERGQVISSPTSTVGGGTVLLKMADLNRVQVNTLVDETDIGKIQPGLSATVTVDAFPSHPFEGTVLKIEPQATVQQNVTMFPVRVRIDNREGLLKPGMNTEVEIHIGRRDGVLAVPNAALRTQKDVSSAAEVLGLSPQDVQAELAKGQDSGRGKTQVASAGAPAAPPGNTMTTSDGRTMKLPDGVTEDRVKAIFAKFRNGETPTADERGILQKLRAANAGMGGGGAGAGGNRGRGVGGADNRFGGRYIVFILRGGKPTPVNIRTGLTDLDNSEVVSGLQEGDSVLILPSQSLVDAQKDFKERIGRITGGGLPGLKQQTPATGATATPGASGAPQRPGAGRP